MSTKSETTGTGHRVRGCAGEWIDVSSLAHPQRVTCPICRAVCDGVEEEARVEPVHAVKTVRVPRWALAVLLLALIALAYALLTG